MNWRHAQTFGHAALERAEDSKRQETRAPQPTLTDRQTEVLDLVSAGMSDREIAQELVISEHTVHRHIANILVRLDVPTRAAATAYAAKRGLT